MNRERREEDEYLAGLKDEPQGNVKFPRLRHQYDEKRDAEERLATDIVNNEPSLTQQHYKDEVDINVMMRRMGVTDGAIIPPYFHESVLIDHFADFSEAPDFRTSMDQLKEATDAFNQLPAALRRRFGNDPVELMNFLHDKDNIEEAIKLGLLTKMPEQLPEGVANRRALREWVAKNPEEARELGYVPNPTPPKAATDTEKTGVT